MANAMDTTYTVEGLTVVIEGQADFTYGVMVIADNGLSYNHPRFEDYEWDLECWDTIDEARDEADAFIESLVNPH